MVTLASLFDGIGGAPLCATMCGAVPVWSSEIEPIPISITKRHFPDMKHYGDITKISGAEVEPVDIIVGGSPCQDLSVAGKRAGLDGARSGLFMEQIRIVKEMRDATNGIYPRFMVWENVPGAFSSNGGEDFRAVLEETARVADPTIRIPRCEAWSNAGSILGDGFSVSWRVIDAQYWGVPQRRRRIYLVADFGGQSAPEILFERDGLSGHFAESGAQGKGTAGDAEKGVNESNCLTPWDVQSRQIYSADGPWMTLYAGQGGGRGYAYFQQGVAGNDVSHIAATLRNQSHGHEPVICLQGNGIDRADTVGCNGKGQCECVSYTLNTIDRPAVFAQQRSDEYQESGVVSTQAARQYKDATDLVVEPQVQGVIYGQTSQANTGEVLRMLQKEIGEKAVAEWGFRVIVTLQQKKILRQEMYGKVILQTRNGIKVLEYDALEGKAEEVARRMRDMSEAECKRCSPQRRKPSEQLTREFATYMSELSQQDSPKEKFVQDMWETGQGAWILREALPEIQKIWESICVQKKSTYAIGSVRRLTVKECCRLQGYPDNWTALTHDGKPVSDSARYKALGNSFAIPCALYVIQGCVEVIHDELGVTE
jgi:site-specific DNA-cytosine methylase